jgi:hypothetical protein
MNEFSTAQKKDLRLLLRFVGLHCRDRHDGERLPATEIGVSGIDAEGTPLCGECRDLLAYAVGKRRKCPLDPKPSCKHCSIHCYSREYRARIREIMAYSGKKLILRGRIDLLWHYFF